MSQTVVRSIFDVVSLTSIIVLLVLGMAVIVGMMRVFNMCQGELVLLGALTVYLTNEWVGSVVLGMVLAPIVVGLFGLLLERLVIRRFYASPAGALLATYAVGFLIREITRARMNVQAGAVTPPIDGTVSIGGAQVSAWRVVIIVATLLVVVGCFLILNRTSLGLRVRGTLDNPELVAASGVSTRVMYAGTYAFGSALAGLAGALIVPLQTLYPNLGLDNLIPMFISVMVGGLGTFEGPLMGAAAVGAPSAALPIWVSPVIAQVVVVLAAIVFMRFRPSGLKSR